MDCPEKCPSEIYLIMRACWHSNPLLRPNFAELIQDINKLTFQEQELSQDPLQQSQYLYCGLETLDKDPPQPCQNDTTTSRSTNWNCLCSQFDMNSIKEHPFAITLIIIILTMFIVGIGVGFGVDWQGSGSSSVSPCICEEGKFKMSTFSISDKLVNHNSIARVPLHSWRELFHQHRGCFSV